MRSLHDDLNSPVASGPSSPIMPDSTAVASSLPRRASQFIEDSDVMTISVQPPPSRPTDDGELTVEELDTSSESHYRSLHVWFVVHSGATLQGNRKTQNRSWEKRYVAPCCTQQCVEVCLTFFLLTVYHRLATLAGSTSKALCRLGRPC